MKVRYVYEKEINTCEDCNFRNSDNEDGSSCNHPKTKPLDFFCCTIHWDGFPDKLPNECPFVVEANNADKT